MSTLKSITTKIGSGATPRGGKNSYQSTGITLIRSLNVYDFKFENEGLAFIDNDQAAELSNVAVEADDILLNITGASVARCCMVPPRVLPARVNQHVAIIRVDQRKADPYYVLYSINSPQYKDRLLAIAQGGATREALTKETIENFEIQLLSLTAQKKISAILSAYDDLIQNNLRRIKILEEMAQSLYREWFVNFRFSGHEKVEFVDSELGKIPKGWEVKRVLELVKRLPAGAKYTEGNVVPRGSVPVVDQSRSELMGFHDNEPDHVASSDNPIIIFGDHTCKMQLMVEPFSVGPNVVPFSSASCLPITYLFFLIRNLVETREYKRHWTELVNKKVVVELNDLPAQFSNFTKAPFAEIHCLIQKNLILRQTRDLLLPKLISGELDVEDLDIRITAAADVPITAAV